MKLFKKIAITLVAICLFIGATVGFIDVLQSFRVPETEREAMQNREAYPRALIQPTEEPEFTLPVPESTESETVAVPTQQTTAATVPVETSAGETEPAVTAQAETEPEATELTQPQPTEAASAETVPETTAAEETLPETIAAETTVPEETVPEEMDLTSVPRLYMSDYPDVRYLTGSLATSGSNVTSLAMVASYLTGQEYWPDELLGYFSDYIGNSMQWLEYAADQLQLPWQNSGNFYDVVDALEEGKLAIIVMGERKFYTENLHFLVLTGMDENGNIQINDPLRSHYSHWNLGEKLETGFTANELIGGYKGGWIFDPEAMPEEPFVYTPEENTEEPRYPGVELGEVELELMAKVIYMEAQSEPFEGQQAIAEVILNRLVSENFPDNIRSVVYAKDQFRGATQLYRAKPTHIQYEAVRRALEGPYVLDEGVVFFAGFAVTENVWGTIGAHTFCYPE